MEKNTISINKKIAEKQKNIEISGDIIVPDNKPDIINVIATNCNPYITKEDINDGKYRFDGIINTNIIYLSENGENQCIKTKLNFMEFIEDEKLLNSVFSKYNINVLKIESRILNERKISVTVNLKINFSFFEKNEVEYFDNIELTENVEKLQESIKVNSLLATNKVNTTLKEDIIADENSEVFEVLKTDVFVTNIENKISYNKVLSKADVQIRLLYLNQNFKVQSFDTSIPVMNFIDVEKISDDNICNINYKMRNMEFDIDQSENKKINCKIDFEVICETYKVQEITIIQDMYGINKEITFNKKDVEVQTIAEPIREKVSVNESISVENIKSIYDVDYRVNIVNKTVTGNVANFEGEINADIYYDSGNMLCSKNVKIPFVSTMNNCFDVEINFLRKHFKLINEEVLFDLELELFSSDSSYKKINIIENIQEKEEKIDDDYSMIVYFVKKDDTIWQIAKNFRVPMSDIIQMNNLDDAEEIYPGEKLYIVK